MDATSIRIWLQVLTRAVAGGLAAQGKTDQAALLNDAASAIQRGANVDDIMAEAAEKWATNGEPTFDEIAAARQAIQDRV